MLELSRPREAFVKRGIAILLSMDRETAPSYLSFLLRVWKNDNSTGWHASLEMPHADTRVHFATLHDLVLHIEKETGEEIMPPQNEPGAARRMCDPKRSTSSRKRSSS